MIFQNTNGSIIIINKYDFKNDNLYYKQIYDMIKNITNTNISKV
jgi:hypothetical protein